MSRTAVLEEPAAVRMEQKPLKKAVWFVTLRCNMHCPYCHAAQVKDPLLDHPFEAPEKWIEGWARIRAPVQIDITGGEPFLQPGFVEILEGLDPTKVVAVTTNLKSDLTRFVQRISPEKCFSITASLHPSQAMNVETFLGKALLLKHRGFHVQVNFVAYPEQMWMIERFRDLMTRHGLPFHVDPYTPGPRYPYRPSARERAHLERWFPPGRDDPYATRSRRYLCDAGMNYFVVSPDGTVSPCVSRIYRKEFSMGNLFDQDFQLLEEPIRCSSRFCSGCDADKTERVILGEDLTGRDEGLLGSSALAGEWEEGEGSRP